MKPHIKVIQRNGVDIFVTSSMQMKCCKSELKMLRSMSAAAQSTYIGMQNCVNPNYSAGYNCSEFISHMPINYKRYDGLFNVAGRLL